MRARRALRNLAAILAACVIAGAAAADEPSDGMEALDRIVAGVRRAGRIERASVEAVLGTALRRTEGTGSFALYEAGGVPLAGLTTSVDLRLPIPGGGATAGPLLVLRISGACLRRAPIAARYAPWTLTNVPHGHSWEEETSWTRSEPWGTLSFGFPEANPDCLRTVVYQGRRPGAPR